MTGGVLDASSLLDWAQTTYGTLFNGPASDGYADVPGLGRFYYRHWTSTGNYVGILDGICTCTGRLRICRSRRSAALQDFLCLVRSCTSSGPVQTRMAGLRMANWYPAANSWTNMWINFDPALIQREFAALASAGFNAVRIFPNTPAPAFTVPSPPAAMLSELAQVIDLADKAGLKVPSGSVATQLAGTLHDAHGHIVWMGRDRHCSLGAERVCGDHCVVCGR
jgi:hypothetical protein